MSKISIGNIIALAALLIGVPAALVLGTHRQETQFARAYLRPAACAIVRERAPDRLVENLPDRCLVKIDKVLENIVVSDQLQISPTELIGLLKQ